MFELILAGILQGIIEWLPISSQGIISLLLTNWGYTLEQAVDIALFLHLGTLGATVSYFWKDLVKMSTPKSVKDIKVLSFILWTTIISLIIGGPLYFILPLISEQLSNNVEVLIGGFLIITGIINLMKQSFGNREYKSVGRKDGIINGIAQGFSALPGISRSGSTTLALVIQGFNAESALRLSFFSSIPVIFLVQLYTGLKNGFFLSIGYVLAGITAFIVGRITIKYLLQITKKVNFSLFCFVFGILTIIL